MNNSKRIWSLLLCSLRKIRGFASIFVFYLFLFVCFDLLLRAFGFGYPSHYQEENVLRYPFPYDMFRGAPDIQGHNQYGFKGADPTAPDNGDTYRIAFYGGSTGYNGKPPIMDRLVQVLNEEGLNGMDVGVTGFNFSSVSSNHNQHLHRLVEFMDTRFDLVIFYGGSNESNQTYLYDPRPGYPYNFFVRSNLSPIRLFLIRYSAFFGEVDKHTGLISGLSALQRERDENFEGWISAVVDNYVSVHKHARLISETSVTPAQCSATQYLPVLQPVNLKMPELVSTYDKLAEESLRSVEGLVDLRHLAEKLSFRDLVHVDDVSKQVIAEELAPIVKELLIGCRN